MLSEISAIIESQDVQSVIILGDFNAHPGEMFGSELFSFCAEQSWTCADLDLLPTGTYTFVSDAHGCRRWLDHCVVTEAARHLLVSATVLYDTYWSDHMPIQLQCNFNMIRPTIVTHNPSKNRTIWGERDTSQISKYKEICHTKLREINFPLEFEDCAKGFCTNINHKLVLDNMYKNIVCILTEAAQCPSSLDAERGRRGKHVVGWNRHVKQAHADARLAFHIWSISGKPTSGYVYKQMYDTRKVFKSKLKWCQNNQNKIKMDILADNHKSKDFSRFWKNTNRLNPKPGVPVSMAGQHEPSAIANLFVDQFKVESPLGSMSQAVDAEDSLMELNVRFSTKDVATIIKNMVRGKSPGHDYLSIEHLQHAGVHLPRVLAMFFSLCLSHAHLPSDLMKTVVVPVVKNKTGDTSDLANYRPISLATVIAKVLDSLLDRHMATRIELHDAQFGFRPGLSTESAILSLKHTVQYYTSRKTPVNACFLDLSKAFDLVSYDLLWQKLLNDTTVDRGVISIIRYWYKNQINCVRWAGSLSDVYRLECGVRQGGLTSPRLFSLYINKLIVELSSICQGCYVDGICVNNISYADDMVLLSPSINSMTNLLRICEGYAGAHGLRYNVKKSEILVFKAGTKTYPITPQLKLCGSPLNQVTSFKYLGHWVSEDLRDSLDIERERRALAVRCNMLARRFAKCSTDVKATLFTAYCQSFYTCSLWVNYTQGAYSALRVQYNNAYRVLMGLPRYCSASGMFAEAGIDGFHAIIRKRCASIMRRVRDSPNSILSTIADRWDSPMLGHWTRLHATVAYLH